MCLSTCGVSTCGVSTCGVSTIVSTLSRCSKSRYVHWCIRVFVSLLTRYCVCLSTFDFLNSLGPVALLKVAVCTFVYLFRHLLNTLCVSPHVGSPQGSRHCCAAQSRSVYICVCVYLFRRLLGTVCVSPHGIFSAVLVLLRCSKSRYVDLCIRLFVSSFTESFVCLPTWGLLNSLHTVVLLQVAVR